MVDLAASGFLFSPCSQWAALCNDSDRTIVGSRSQAEHINEAGSVYANKIVDDGKRLGLGVEVANHVARVEIP